MPRLFIVATPIGNLSDISARALQTLRDCDLIAAEDTRVTRALLNHFEINTPCVSNHQHNEENRADSGISRASVTAMQPLPVPTSSTAGLSGAGDSAIQRTNSSVSGRGISTPSRTWKSSP